MRDTKGISLQNDILYKAQKERIKKDDIYSEYAINRHAIRTKTNY